MQEDETFFPTTACRNVENVIKRKNLVIVAGHSGCGKTAIVQHIALKYRKNGWVVKPVDDVDEIKTAYTSGKFKTHKTIFVFNDPIGKECLNDMLYTEWKKYERTLTLFLKNVKLLLTCRTYIVFNPDVKGLFQEKSNIVVVDDEQNKLIYSEKRDIFRKYTKIDGISEETLDKVLQIETYFPLLCNSGITPFYTACENGHDNIAQLLINNSADVNLCESDGESFYAELVELEMIR